MESVEVPYQHSQLVEISGPLKWSENTRRKRSDLHLVRKFRASLLTLTERHCAIILYRELSE
jgi:hypothetical protein